MSAEGGVTGCIGVSRAEPQQERWALPLVYPDDVWPGKQAQVPSAAVVPACGLRTTESLRLLTIFCCV